MFLLTRGCILAALRAFCDVDSMFASLVAAGCLGVAKPAFGGSRSHWSLVDGGKRQGEQMAEIYCRVR